jgi:hypothetical protein
MMRLGTNSTSTHGAAPSFQASTITDDIERARIGRRIGSSVPVLDGEMDLESDLNAPDA